ncbi:MAG: 4Fe-4S binding protein [Candidatus Heimdallarchaeaceae archaeon]
MTKDNPSMPILFPVEGAAGETGDWRTEKPILDPAKCKFCNICWEFCPDLAITAADKEAGKVIEFDYVYCKGCGICANECPFGAIHMEREVT